jgi:TetR/AcrR family transcriptional repressor of nem operon
MDDHIIAMSKLSNREKLLSEGLRVVHERGYAASVRDIVEAAGVPQGSFTNHFVSKEAFGLEIVDLYYAAFNAEVAATLRSDALPPLRRLRRWFQDTLDSLKRDDMRRGCLYGNMSAEASEHSELIRTRIAGIFRGNQETVAYCLRAAVEAGELRRGIDVRDTAGFIISGFEGAILIAKAQRSPEPIERFVRVLFSSVLTRELKPTGRRPGPASSSPRGLAKRKTRA